MLVMIAVVIMIVVILIVPRSSTINSNSREPVPNGDGHEAVAVKVGLGERCFKSTLCTGCKRCPLTGSIPGLHQVHGELPQISGVNYYCLMGN